MEFKNYSESELVGSAPGPSAWPSAQSAQSGEPFWREREREAELSGSRQDQREPEQTVLPPCALSGRPKPGWAPKHSTAFVCPWGAHCPRARVGSSAARWLAPGNRQGCPAPPWVTQSSVDCSVSTERGQDTLQSNYPAAGGLCAC